MTVEEKQLKFKVDSALLSELGERLVETVHVALVELVKNAYDADATSVKVEFYKDENNKNCILVEDDGGGMSFVDVENYWMRIATNNKFSNNRSSKYGRLKTGSKGIGRFSCRRLGKHLQLKTVGYDGKELQKTEATFKWKNFKAGKDVTEIPCPGQKTVLRSGKTGTVLTISELNEEWTQRGYNYLKRNLAVLVANQGAKRKGYEIDPGFKIILDAPNFDNSGGVKDLRDELMNSGWGTLTAWIDENHHAVCELEALDLTKKRIVSKDKYENLKDIDLKIGILVEDKTQHRNTKILSKHNLNQILTDWGGVQVRQNGVRVFPYGDDDWLDIDSDRGLRKASPKNQLLSFASTLKGVDPGRSLLNMLSMRNHIGSVNIGEGAEGFDAKANREGFLQSEAFDELKAFVRFGIQWATIYRDYSIRVEKQKESNIAREVASEAIQNPIDPSLVVETAVEYIKKEAKTLASTLPTEEKRQVQLTFDAITDALLKHEESNKAQLSHLRLVASTSTILLVVSHEMKSLLGQLDSNQSKLGTIEKKLTGPDREIVANVRRDMVSTKQRFSDLLEMTNILSADHKHSRRGSLALKERVEKAILTFDLIIDRYDIEVDISEVREGVVIGNVYEAEIYSILLNVISNSIKSVIAGSSNPKIKIIAEKEKSKVSIRVLDNGIGIKPDHYEDVFMPFISDPEGKLYSKLERKLNPEDNFIVGTGSGLGLGIVKEIVTARDGSVMFKKPRGNWSAELEIVL